jgi:hypothetical protein
MISAILMLRRLAGALRVALREEDFARILAAGLALIITGTLAYSLGGGWSVVDGFYVAVATLTTSSVLDPKLTVTNPWLKVFTAGYVLVGIGILVEGRSPARHGVHRGQGGSGEGQGSGEAGGGGWRRIRKRCLTARAAGFDRLAARPRARGVLEVWSSGTPRAYRDAVRWATGSGLGRAPSLGGRRGSTWGGTMAERDVRSVNGPGSAGAIGLLRGELRARAAGAGSDI